MFLLLHHDLKSCKSTLEIFQSFFVFSPFTCLNVYHSGITCFLHLALSSHRSESYPPLEYDETHLSSIFSHKLNSLIFLFCRSSEDLKVLGLVCCQDSRIWFKDHLDWDVGKYWSISPSLHNNSHHHNHHDH